MFNLELRKQLKKIILFFMLMSMAACSYSPDSLKKLYSELPTELADDIKESVDLTAKQSHQVDDYTKQLAKWHRRNKLPTYSRHFAALAQLVKQHQPAIAPLQQVLTHLDEMPHFEQARHLTHKMAVVGRSLNNKQIAQLSKSLRDEYEEERLEIRNNALAKELVDDITMMFRFVDIQLNAQQRQVLATEAKHYHDTRFAELEAERKLNHQLIDLLKHRDHPQFVSRFSAVWDNNSPKLSPADRQKQQQNKRTQAVLMQKLIMSFDTEQKNHLANKLLSISYTFSEMANE